MEKLSSILLVVRDVRSSAVLLEKAIALTRRFGAHIELLLADPGQTCAFASHCEALGYDRVTSYALHGSDEPLTDVILRRLRERPVDLLMKSPAGVHPLRRLSKGAGDTELAARSPVPVMLAGDRRWANEPRFAAALDVSERDGDAVARGILHAAGMLATGCEATLDLLYSEREMNDEPLRMERAVRLARLVREFHVGCERLQVFNGAPEKTLPPIISAREYDVLVLGATTHRTGLISKFNTFTSKLVEATQGDVLLVKATERAIEDASTSGVAELAAAAAVHPRLNS